MSLHNPHNVGSTANEAPETVWEFLIETEFNPDLSPAALDRIQSALWSRLHDAISDELGPYVFGNVGVEISDIRGRGEESPLFPVVAGHTRFTCSLDIVELIEHLCHKTDLGKIAYDVCGRAYELDVEIIYVRRPDLDGAQRAHLSDPELVRKIDRERTGNHSR
jgi:hypothetical protein